MKEIAISLALVASALIGQGCSRNTGALCRIQEDVYHHGWKTCGEVIVRPDHSYTYTYFDVWASAPSKQSFTGRLPDSQFAVLSKSVLSSGKFTNTKGLPTYAFGIDDSKTKHPDGVIDVLRIVHDAHVPARIEKGKGIPTRELTRTQYSRADAAALVRSF